MFVTRCSKATQEPRTSSHPTCRPPIGCMVETTALCDQMSESGAASPSTMRLTAGPFVSQAPILSPRPDQVRSMGSCPAASKGSIDRLASSSPVAGREPSETIRESPHSTRGFEAGPGDTVPVPCPPASARPGRSRGARRCRSFAAAAWQSNFTPGNNQHLLMVMGLSYATCVGRAQLLCGGHRQLLRPGTERAAHVYSTGMSGNGMIPDSTSTR